MRRLELGEMVADLPKGQALGLRGGRIGTQSPPLHPPTSKEPQDSWIWGLCLRARCTQRAPAGHQTWPWTIPDCGPHSISISHCFSLLNKLCSPDLGNGQGGGEWCPRPLLQFAVFSPHVHCLPHALTHAAFYESEFGSLSPPGFWKSGYFSRLEEDEKLAVPICSLFLKVGSGRFRDSLNISVYKIRPDHLEWKCGARGPRLGFFSSFLLYGR